MSQTEEVKTPRAPWTAWLTAVLGLTEGGWMLFDGLRRLIVGDFVRIDGQLGAWAQIVAAFGIDPMSMGLPFAVIGALWIVGCFGLVGARTWGWRLTLSMAMISLFYLTFGTLVAFIVLLLLLMRRTREVYVVPREFQEVQQAES